VAISLGSVTFDEAGTTVRENYEEVGGRDVRRIEIAGIIQAHGVADIEAALDAILNVASKEDYSAELRLRPGRRLYVRRAKFMREVCRSGDTGSFVLGLEARDPFEESVVINYSSWIIAASGATIALKTAGNASAMPIVSILASGDLIDPSLSDGSRTLTFFGTVLAGEILTVDAHGKVVTLGNEDVTRYTEGLFPQVEPGGTTLAFRDDTESSHNGIAVITYADRWW